MVDMLKLPNHLLGRAVTHRGFRSPVRTPPAPTVVPALGGVLLRLYELVALDRAPMLAEGIVDLLWSSVPFAFALSLAAFTRHVGPATGFASASLLASLYTHYVLYQAPSQGYDTSLVVLLPLWSMIFVGPLGALVGWLLSRSRPPGAA